MLSLNCYAKEAVILAYAELQNVRFFPLSEKNGSFFTCSV